MYSCRIHKHLPIFELSKELFGDVHALMGVRVIEQEFILSRFGNLVLFNKERSVMFVVTCNEENKQKLVGVLFLTHIICYIKLDLPKNIPNITAIV